MKLPPCLLAFVLFLGAPAHAAEPAEVAALRTLAAHDNPAAQYHLGMLYNNGMLGVGKDPREAFAWFQKSAAGNDPLGAYKAGCYFAGQFPGVVAVDEARALAYKLSAAEAGYALAQADVAIASYKRGDYAQAAAWWTRAADQGHAASAYHLGMLLAQGRVARADNEQGYAYVRLAERLSGTLAPPAVHASAASLADQLAPPARARAERFLANWTEKRSAVTARAAAGPAEIAVLVSAR